VHTTDFRSAVRLEDRQLLKAALDGWQVVLASSSPRRREILKVCGVRFRSIHPDIQEPLPRGHNLRAWTRRWASRKATNVVERMIGRSPTLMGQHLAIAADTIVVLQGRGLGKPMDPAEARSILTRLSGRTHRVITGVAVATFQSGKLLSCRTGSAESQVRFRRLSRSEIERYIASGEPFDKAGGYAIQGNAGGFVARVEGPVDNVIGLPVKCLAQVTRRTVGQL
jgi:septum formation protein